MHYHGILCICPLTGGLTGGLIAAAAAGDSRVLRAEPGPAPAGAVERQVGHHSWRLQRGRHVQVGTGTEGVRVSSLDVCGQNGWKMCLLGLCGCTVRQVPIVVVYKGHRGGRHVQMGTGTEGVRLKLEELWSKRSLRNVSWALWLPSQGCAHSPCV